MLVAKKDGTTRFCVDYRRLNAITKMDIFPLPHIDDSLDLLAKSKYFTVLDLASGYWQVAMEEESREKTAIIRVSCNAVWPLQCASNFSMSNGDHVGWPDP